MDDRPIEKEACAVGGTLTGRLGLKMKLPVSVVFENTRPWTLICRKVHYMVSESAKPLKGTGNLRTPAFVWSAESIVNLRIKVLELRWTVNEVLSKIQEAMCFMPRPMLNFNGRKHEYRTANRRPQDYPRRQD